MGESASKDSTAILVKRVQSTHEAGLLDGVVGFALERMEKLSGYDGDCKLFQYIFLSFSSFPFRPITEPGTRN